MTKTAMDVIREMKCLGTTVYYDRYGRRVKTVRVPLKYVSKGL